MTEPKTLAETPWGQSRIELLVLLVLTTVGLGLLFDLHWLTALMLAPVVTLGLGLSVMAFVHVFWMLVVGIDRLGTILGLRKSPLA